MRHSYETTFCIHQTRINLILRKQLRDVHRPIDSCISTERMTLEKIKGKSLNQITKISPQIQNSRLIFCLYHLAMPSLVYKGAKL